MHVWNVSLFGVCVCVYVCVCGWFAFPIVLGMGPFLPRNQTVLLIAWLALQSDWNKSDSQLSERFRLCCVLLCCFCESGTRNVSSDYNSFGTLGALKSCKNMAVGGKISSSGSNGCWEKLLAGLKQRCPVIYHATCKCEPCMWFWIF